MKLLYLLLFSLFIFTQPCIAQKEAAHTIALQENKVSPKANLSMVSWITGAWEGEAFGGAFEEIWAAPQGNSMMGMFKLWEKGQIAFYELLTISEENESLILRLKHFNSDLKGWEEKDISVDFPLVKIETNKVFFNNYTFEKIDDNTIHCYVVIEKEEVKFVFKRKSLE